MPVTYVHNGKEVVLTGRKAVKQTRTSIRSKQPTQGEPHVLYEITPAGEAKGTFTIWVAFSELYLIEDMTEELCEDKIDE